MILSRLRVALVLSVLGAGLALGVALGSEAYGLVPCALCLVERWPYRVALALGIAGLLLPRPWARLALWGVLLATLAAVGTAGLHVGVEQGTWPSPLPECVAPNLAGLSARERLARMPAVASKSCEDPTRLVEAIPVSMAQLNLGYALAFSALLASFLLRTRRSEP